MQVCYSDTPLPEDLSNSLFLAGPTPRSSRVKSWRSPALQILSELKFTGLVLVPEWSSSVFLGDYLSQVEWEEQALDNATAIVFWVPRVMGTMPALTTNVEFGRYVSIAPHRVFYGRPDWAERVRYLDWLYQRYTQRKAYDNLDLLLAAALDYPLLR